MKINTHRTLGFGALATATALLVSLLILRLFCATRNVTSTVLQLFVIFIAFLFIHKFAVFIPTYSTVPYGKMNLIHVIIPVIFLLLCMKSSISEKLSILLDRFMIISGLSQKENMEEKKNTQEVQTQMPFNPIGPPQSTMVVKEPVYQQNYQNQNQKRNLGGNYFKH